MVKLLAIFLVALFCGSALAFDSLDEKWVQLWDGPAQEDDEGRNLVLDGSGGVVVAGLSISIDSDDLVVLDYDADGTLAWAAAADASGNFLITGETTFPPQNRDFATVSFGPPGQQRWTAEWASAAGTNGRPLAIAVLKKTSA